MQKKNTFFKINFILKLEKYININFHTAFKN